MNNIKIIIFLLFTVIFVGFLVSGYSQYLSLETLQNQRAELSRSFANQPFLFAVSFFILYFLFALCALPGASVMSISAGAFFGISLGFALASFAAALGATALCALSRYVFKDAVYKRFETKIDELSEHLDANGPMYLFALRMTPIMPFFIINICLGFTNMRLRTFYWVSQLGMVASTLLLVNAGAQLADIQTINALFSMPIIVSFIALGLLPLVAKKVFQNLELITTNRS